MKKPFQTVYYSENDLKACGFKSVGKNVSIHESCIIIGMENISICDNVRIDPFVSIIATGPVTLGSFIHVGAYSLLSAGEGIIMEDFSGLSQGVKIYTRSADYSGRRLTNPTVPKKYGGGARGPVTLKRHVIIGAGTIILPDVTIGEGASVGALSLVTRSLKEWYMYSGIPAKRMKERSKDLLKLEAELRREIEETGIGFSDEPD